jgi:ABC-type Mn2+/Zn2+ transport system permease subunit
MNLPTTINDWLLMILVLFIIVFGSIFFYRNLKPIIIKPLAAKFHNLPAKKQNYWKHLLITLIIVYCVRQLILYLIGY